MIFLKALIYNQLLHLGTQSNAHTHTYVRVWGLWAGGCVYLCVCVRARVSVCARACLCVRAHCKLKHQVFIDTNMMENQNYTFVVKFVYVKDIFTIEFN